MTVVPMDMDKFWAHWEEQEKIRCPYCNKNQNLNLSSGEYPELVTYWGDGDIVILECVECEKEFKVVEFVRRTFDVAEIDKDFYA